MKDNKSAIDDENKAHINETFLEIMDLKEVENIDPPSEKKTEIKEVKEQSNIKTKKVKVAKQKKETSSLKNILADKVYDIDERTYIDSKIKMRVNLLKLESKIRISTFFSYAAELLLENEEELKKLKFIK